VAFESDRVQGFLKTLPAGAIPFFVLATQNPIEMEGTYPLPGALARPGSYSSGGFAIRRSRKHSAILDSPELAGLLPGTYAARVGWLG
jgi:ATPase family associated with various cellular activities (AAA)